MDLLEILKIQKIGILHPRSHVINSGQASRSKHQRSFSLLPFRSNIRRLLYLVALRMLRYFNQNTGMPLKNNEHSDFHKYSNHHPSTSMTSELIEPLDSIRMLLEILADSPVNPLQRRYIATALQNLIDIEELVSPDQNRTHKL